MGQGTQGLSVTEHGPHVDKRGSPADSLVKIGLYIPELGKAATITRQTKSPTKSLIEPNDDAVKAVLAEIAEHPEITLSRRDIARFILIEPSKRSEEIQALLKLDRIGANRSALLTAKNRLQGAHTTASAKKTSISEKLCRHLQIEEFTEAEFLTEINKHRVVLELPGILTLTTETDVTAGLSESARVQEPNKQSALSDLSALATIAGDFPNLCAAESDRLIADLTKLENDPALFTALQRRSFFEKGLELVDGPECPLCDTLWPDEQHLRVHLQNKLAKAQEARDLQESLLQNGSAIASELTRIVEVIRPIHELAHTEGEEACTRILSDWKVDLEKLKPKLITDDGVIELKERLKSGWVNPPELLSESLRALTEKIEAKPDQSASIAAQTFLTTAQIRLSDYRTAVREENLSKAAGDRGRIAYETYCAVSEEVLAKLYSDIQSDFSVLYQELNGSDERDFTAKFTPQESKLDLDVDFYGRGLFPPGAYHSEGHQDGMGVCLYLALMKHLFGNLFSLALLDDVLMSIDSGHRAEFCKLLKNHFPETQFLITTHDRLWAEQMKSAGLVNTKTSIAFHSWTIDTGPLVESSAEIWGEIDDALAKDKVETAAFYLRRHLEYVSTNLADQLGASPQFRADGNYDLGDLLPSVLTRMDKLLGKAVKAAQSWNKQSVQAEISNRRSKLSTSKEATRVEQWAVNKAVHYNAWANFERNDFKPVVSAFRDLLGKFHCEKCESWLYVTPKRGMPEALRCDCAEVDFNLKEK